MQKIDANHILLETAVKITNHVKTFIARARRKHVTNASYYSMIGNSTVLVVPFYSKLDTNTFGTSPVALENLRYTSQLRKYLEPIWCSVILRE